MNVTMLGGNGLIGTKLTKRLRALDHRVNVASRASGVDSVGGKGLADALAGADVVVDVTNSPSFADEEVMAFFKASTGNLLAAARKAGVRHFVALSVVGTDRITDS